MDDEQEIISRRRLILSSQSSRERSSRLKLENKSPKFQRKHFNGIIIHNGELNHDQVQNRFADVLSQPVEEDSVPSKPFITSASSNRRPATSNDGQFRNIKHRLIANNHNLSKNQPTHHLNNEMSPTNDDNVAIKVFRKKSTFSHCKMTIDEALIYLQNENRQREFFYGIQRHVVEKMRKPNFYDLILYERPDPIWKNNTQLEFVQFSLEGLLFTSSKSIDDTFISLSVFLEEKNQFNLLRKKKLFNYFQEIKMFSYWKKFRSVVKFKRSKELIELHSIYSDLPVVQIIAKVQKVVYNLENTVEMFWHHGFGSINIKEYLVRQIGKIDEIGAEVKVTIEKLLLDILHTFQFLTSKEYLHNKIEQIILQHPFSKLPNENISWENVHGIKRLSSAYHSKIEKIYKIAHYMVETAIAQIMYVFWVRFSQFISGIRPITIDTTGKCVLWDCCMVKSLLGSDRQKKREIQRTSNNITEELKTAIAPVLVLRKQASIEEAAIPELQIRDPTESDLNLEITAKSITGRQGSFFVTEEWQGQGCYLSVANMLVFSSETCAVNVNDNLVSANLNMLRVTMSPTRIELITLLNELYTSFGKFLERLPQFRFPDDSHQDKQFHRHNESYLNDEELSIVEMKGSSSTYFKQLKLSSVLSSQGLFSIAVKCMHLAREAYSEASDIEQTLNFLQDVFRKTWGVAPDNLCKHLERSSILLKIKESVDESNFDMDDVVAIVGRDVAKLQGLQRTIDQLQQTKRLAEEYRDIKNEIGLITTFKPILKQITDARYHQLSKIQNRLPNSFITRCKEFVEFISTMKAHFNYDVTTLPELIYLLNKIKTFDSIKDLFDEEIAICEAMFRLIKEGEQILGDTTTHQLKSAETDSVLLNSLLSQNHTSSTNLFKLYMKEKDGLLHCIASSRMLILKSLSSMRHDALADIRTLHRQITETIQLVAKTDFSEGHDVKLQNMTEAHNVLRNLSDTVRKLREKVQLSIRTQNLLSEADIIVGAASNSKEAEEIDNFTDMDSLENFLNFKYRTCNSIIVADSLRNTLMKSKFGNCDSVTLYQRYKELLSTLEFLSSKSTSDNLCDNLRLQLSVIEPLMELASYLKNPSMKIKHWDELLEMVFVDCKLKIRIDKHIDSSLVYDESVLTNDLEGGLPLGTLRSIQLGVLAEKGLLNHLNEIRNVTAEAYIESILEKTLDAIEFTVKSCKVQLSLDWLEDSLLKNKIFFELHRVTNCFQLLVLVQYCMYCTSVVEHAARDMNMTQFDSRTGLLRNLLEQMIVFIKGLDKLQMQWLSVFYSIKFSPQGELDRETERLFQSCTEDLKKIEICLQSSAPNTFYNSFLKLKDTTTIMENTLANLAEIIEDIHAGTQSMLSACPRLSLLPYHRTKYLIKYWNMNPFEKLSFINICMHEMFEGVGVLKVEYDQTQRLHYCYGFLSYDKIELITFEKNIPMNGPLDEFIKAFDCELRQKMVRACDALIANRLKSLKSLLLQDTTTTVFPYLKEYFYHRYALIVSEIFSETNSDLKPNQCIALIYKALFDEDIWLCLGHPVGCTLMARPDIEFMRKELALKWSNSLGQLLVICKDNLSNIQLALQSSETAEKSKSIFAALFQLEVYFVQVIEDLMNCPCIESSIELWVSKYQLRYLYNKNDRINCSPFEVNIGFMSVSYGFEYQGAYCRLLTGARMEEVLHKVVGSASMLKGSLFVAYDDENSVSESIGEYTVSCRDIAGALGRVYTLLTCVLNENSVKLLLSRLLYLDAVGCIDFTSMDNESIQVLIETLQVMIDALRSRDDYMMVGSLKYPLKTRYAQNTLHAARKNSSMIDFRENVKIRGTMTTGIFLIGLISETLYSSVNVIDSLSKHSFDVVAIEHNKPIYDLGILLGMYGFKYGMLLQMILLEAIKVLFEKFKYQTSIRLLSSSRMIKSFAKRASTVLISGKVHLANNRKETTGKNLLNLEMACLYSVLMEQVLIFGQHSNEELEMVQKEVQRIMQDNLNAVLAPADRFQLETEYSQHTKLSILPRIRDAINNSMRNLGFIQGSMFVEQCAALWSLLTNSNRSLVIISGPIGCGKTSVWKTVLNGIRKEGFRPQQEIFANFLAIRLWRATIVLVRAIRRWLKKREVNGNTITKARRISTINSNLAENIQFNVHTTIVYPTSLSVSQFLGYFEADGRWFDGLFARLLRRTDDISMLETTRPVLQVIVLVGPIGSQVEMCFGASQSYSSKNVPFAESECNRVVLPSGETCILDKTVCILVEASDLSNASPQLLMHVPHVHCGVAPSHCARRIVIVWLRSLRNWMLQFNPWQEVVKMLNEILLNSSFLKDMLCCDMSLVDLSPVSTLCRISTFLRYFEQLIYECHILMLTESNSVLKEPEIFKVQQRGGSDSENDESISPKPSNINILLSAKGKERLATRVKLALTYSAIWGFGCSANGSEKKSLFEVVARQCFDRHLTSIKLAQESSLFELIIDLENCCFLHALYCSPIKYPNQINSKSIAQNYVSYSSRQPLDATVEITIIDKSTLLIQTPSLHASEVSLLTLLKSGANVIVGGSAGCGKTALVEKILSKLSENCPSPSTMRTDILRDILRILGDNVIPAGIPSVLDVIRRALKELSVMTPVHDDLTSKTKIWQSLRKCLAELMPRKTTRDFVDSKSIFYSKISLNSVTTAIELREWLVRELKTEIAEVLESPRDTYGIVFIDDLHFIKETESLDNQFNDSRCLQNKISGVIHGLLDDSKVFGIAVDMATESKDARKGLSFPSFPNSIPVLHRTLSTDPRLTCQLEEEDYNIHQLGMICAASGSIYDLEKCSRFSQLMSKMTILNIPSLTPPEQKSALIFSIIKATSFTDCAFFVSEIRDLSTRMTRVLDVFTVEDPLSDTEKQLLKGMMFTPRKIADFCKTIQLGSLMVKDSSHLARLWCHEWKRHYLDHLPPGNFRNRLLWSFRNQFNSLDISSYGTDSAWLNDLINMTVNIDNDAVWLDMSTIQSECSPIYRPYRFLPNNMHSTLLESKSIYELEIDARPFFLKNIELSLLMHPGAISYVLKLIRLIWHCNKHIYVNSRCGTAAIAACKLASLFCKYEPIEFKCKFNPSIPTQQSNDDTVISFDFQRCIKNAILICSGFIREQFELLHNSNNNATFLIVPPRKVSLILSNAQLLTLEERSILHCLIDDEDPAKVFSEIELAGLSQVLYKSRAVKSTKQPENSSNSKVDENDSSSDLSEESVSLAKEILSRNPLLDLKNDRNSKTLQGYTYRWIKSYLCNMVAENLRIILQIESTSFVELEVDDSLNSTDPAIQIHQHNIEQADLLGSNSPFSSTSLLIRDQKRFSLMSQSALHRQAYSFMTNTNLFNGAKKNSQRARDESLVKTSVLEPLLICKILGSTLIRKFSGIWWTLSRSSAVSGICKASLNSQQLQMQMAYNSPQKFVVSNESNSNEAIRFVVHCSKDDDISRKFSMLNYLGVFESYSIGQDLFNIGKESIAFRPKSTALFKRRSSTVLLLAKQENLNSCFELHDAVRLKMEQNIEKSCIILQKLLTLSLPTDSVISPQPLIHMESEKQTEIACMIVKNMVTYGYRLLHIHRDELVTVKYLEDEALKILSSLTLISDKLEVISKELIVAIRSISKTMSLLSVQIDQFDVSKSLNSRGTTTSEGFDMQNEEIHSIKYALQQLRITYESSLQENVDCLKSISIKDWTEFGRSFEKSKSKLHIAAVKMLFLVSNSIPSSSINEMNTSIDDSTICRLAQSMLKTQSMFQKLCSVNPSKLLPQQLEQLKIVNQSLSTQFTTTNVCSSKAFFDDDVSNSESVSENSVNAYDINNQEIFLKIVHYLRGLQLSAELNLLMMSQQAKLELRIKVLRDSNDLLKSEQNNVLTEMKENFKSLEAELHSLDFELFACKEKLKRVQLLLKDKVKYELAIKESRSFLCADIDIIDSVIKNLVGDACLAAVILVRCGYLPDHIRAETFDVFRNAIKKDFTCTESPFVLGSLVDRLQLRSWTQHGKEFCVRDIPTINSLSLLYLCPYNIFIIDPEGISLKSIINSWNCIYDCYEVNGKGFSLASLSIWTEKTVVADQICMVIVYDVQSGVSNDLIAFLCGEYYESEITGAERNEALGDKDNSISFIFNPHHLTYTDSKRFGKVKLILISSEPPTIDNNGIGRPLPSSCFNSLTIIHWVNCNIISPCLYESRPALWWSNKIFASSYLNEFCYFKYLAEKIAPDHFSKLNLLGTRLVDCTIDLFATEHMALSSIMQWEKRQAINSIDSPIYSKFVSLPRVSLCFLEDEECCQSLLGAVSRRNVTKNVITNTKLLERESLAYQKVISETFSLASELLKMSNLIIPDHLFPPHSLTSPNLMKRVAKSLIDNANNSKYLKKIPLSLRHMHKITNAISLLQRKFQEHLGNQGRDVSEALDYSKKNRSPLKPNSVRATLRNSNRSSLFAQKNPEQKTSKRRWSLVRKLSKPIEGQKRKFTHLLKEFKIDEFIALSPSKRRQLMADLSVLSKPLHNIVLKETMSVLRDLIKPGYEYILNICLVLVTWNQANPLPSEELRTFAFFLNKTSQRSLRYFILQPPIVSNNDNKEEEYQSSIQTATTTHASNIFSKSNSMLSLDSSQFLRLNQEFTDPKSLEWLSRGCGVIDGIWIQRRSQRWKIGYVDQKQENFLDGLASIRWDCVFCDQKGSEIIPKNSFFRPQPRDTDEYLLELLRLLGGRFEIRNGSERNTSRHSKISTHKLPEKITSLTTQSTIRQSVRNKSMRKQSISVSLQPDNILSRSTAVTKPLENVKRNSSIQNSHIVTSMANEDKIVSIILQSEDAVKNLRILERHSATASVFGGISIYMGQYYEEFETWKNNVNSISSLDLLQMSTSDLIALTASIIPPQLFSGKAPSISPTGIGYWAAGRELSILQTLIFFAATSSFRLEMICSLYFSLLSRYLNEGAVILKHRDEFSEDELSDEDEDDCYDSGGDTDIDCSNIVTEEQGLDEELAEYSDEFDDTYFERKESMQIIDMDEGRFQDNIEYFNCWTRLKRMVAGTEKRKYVRHSKRKSPYAICCRDYENWEMVFLYFSLEDCLWKKKEYQPLSLELQNILSGVNTIFLASDHLYRHMTNLTMLAREFISSGTTNTVFSAINCDINDRSNSTRGLINLSEKIFFRHKAQNKDISIDTANTSHLAGISSSLTALEAVSLKNAVGNLILEALIEKSRQPANNSDGTTKLQPKILQRSYTLNATPTQTTGNRLWSRNYLISSEWNKLKYQSFGEGPSMLLGEFNTFWLPYYLPSDLIGLVGTKSASIPKSLHLSPMISKRCLREMLEKSTYVVQNNVKCMLRYKISNDVKDIIRNTSRKEIRMTSAVSVIWSLIIQLNSRSRELLGLPAIWSKCLEPLTMWQTARIVIKLHETLSYCYQVIDSSRSALECCEDVLFNDVGFKRMIWLLLESFCRVYYDPNMQEATLETSSTVHRSPIRARMSQLIRADSNLKFKFDNNIKDDTFLSKYTEKILNIAPTESSHSRIKNDSLSLFSNSRTQDKTNYLNFDSLPMKPIKEKPSQIRKRARQKKILEKNEAANIHFVSFDSLSSLGLFSLGSNKRSFLMKEQQERLSCFVGHYIARCIKRNIVSRLNTPVHQPREPATALPDLRWKGIQSLSSTCDISFGCLEFHDMLEILEEWSFCGDFYQS